MQDALVNKRIVTVLKNAMYLGNVAFTTDVRFYPGAFVKFRLAVQKYVDSPPEDTGGDLKIFASQESWKKINTHFAEFSALMLVEYRIITMPNWVFYELTDGIFLNGVSLSVTLRLKRGF